MRSRYIVVVIVFLATISTQSACKKSADSAKEARIESELNNRILYFSQLYGSKEKLERAMGKSIDEIKVEYRQFIVEQIELEEQLKKVKK